MEFLKSVTPEMRRKINIGLLVFTGVQLFALLIMSVFFSNPEPAKKPVIHVTYAQVPNLILPPQMEKRLPKQVERSRSQSSAQPEKRQKIRDEARLLSKKKKTKIANDAKRGPSSKVSKLARRLPPAKAAKRARHLERVNAQEGDDWKVFAAAPVDGASSSR